MDFPQQMHFSHYPHDVVLAQNAKVYLGMKESSVTQMLDHFGYLHVREGAGRFAIATLKGCKVDTLEHIMTLTKLLEDGDKALFSHILWVDSLWVKEVKGAIDLGYRQVSFRQVRDGDQPHQARLKTFVDMTNPDKPATYEVFGIV